MSRCYEEITKRIVEKLESGVAPWRQPWLAEKVGFPRNASTGKPYRGLNVFLLWLTGEERGWTSGKWGTFRQWKALGGSVRKGEKGTQIVFWNRQTRCVDDPLEGEREEQFFIARQYTVFALEQCTGEALEQMQAPQPKREFDDFEPAENAIAATGAQLRFGGSRAFYRIEEDYIQLPHKLNFDSEAHYYSTALHELSHWTGHPNRLNRLKLTARFGDCDYAIEELIAEMAASFLTAELGVPNTAVLDQSASYLAEWLRVLKENNRAIFTAASAATKAADYVMSRQRECAAARMQEAA